MATPTTWTWTGEGGEGCNSNSNSNSNARWTQQHLWHPTEHDDNNRNNGGVFGKENNAHANSCAAHPLLSHHEILCDPSSSSSSELPPSALAAPSCSDSSSSSSSLFLTLSAAEAMNPSRRAAMEDVTIVHLPGQWGCASDPNLGYLAVYDGHGGRDTVDFLKYGLQHHVATEWDYHHDDVSANHPATKLERAFLITDIHANQSGIVSSGSTVALCLIKRLPVTTGTGAAGGGLEIVTANAGDARVVLATSRPLATLWRNEEPAPTEEEEEDEGEGEEEHGGSPPRPSRSSLKAYRLTDDHTPRHPREVQRIEASGGFVVRNRVVGVLAVTRSLGDQVLKRYVIAHPHVCVVSTSMANKEDEKDDKYVPDFVIVACDGLWDVFGDQEAVDFVVGYYYNCQSCCRHASSAVPSTESQQPHPSRLGGVGSGAVETPPLPTLHKAADALVREALRRGTTDNVSVIVAFLNPRG